MKANTFRRERSGDRKYVCASQATVYCAIHFKLIADLVQTTEITKREFI